MSETDATTGRDGARIEAREIAGALTLAPFSYASATQVFTPDGRTTYVEDGVATYGEWGRRRAGAVLVFLATGLPRRVRPLLDRRRQRCCRRQVHRA